MDIRILVMSHKPYWMPKDPVYLPLLLGKKFKPSIGLSCDSSGDNISEKNPNYCELTGLYWAWKNLNADYIGLAHYRRHFTVKPFLFKSPGQKKALVLKEQELLPLLNKFDVIVPSRRKYYIETNRSHYNHAHHKTGLDITERIIRERHPEYLSAFLTVMNRTWAHMFNMFIMKREYLDAYCEWLFSILFELEKRIDICGYDAGEARVFGYIGELLLDVWLEYNKIRYLELDVMFIEKQNWLIKGGSFLKRKFFGKQGYSYENRFK